jgi:outer membrane protein assembly factor BamD (BamD/ComL family)
MQKPIIFYASLVLSVLNFSYTHAQENAAASSSTLARQMFMTGQRMLDEKHYEEAALLFAQLDGNYPLLQDYVQFFLAESSRQADQQEAALSAFQEFLRTSPAHPLSDEARFHTADLLVELHKPADAIPLYQTLLTESGINRGEVAYKLGLALVERSQPQQAASILI